MTTRRLDTFREMVSRSPGNMLARFGLANEALKEGFYEEAVEHLQAYLAGYEDEGNAYGRLAQALEALGRTEEAREALRRGIEASQRFGHAGMANDLSARLQDMEEV